MANHEIALIRIDFGHLKVDAIRFYLTHLRGCIGLQHCDPIDACPELSQSDAEGWQGNSLETIRQMVVSGLGITVMPSSALTPKYQNKRLIAIKLADPEPGRRIGLAWRRGFTRPQVIDVIRSAVHALKVPSLKMAIEGRT